MKVVLRPTRHCVILVMVFIAMLWAAVNYDNNLVYGLLFALISIFLVSAIHTLRNVRRLKVLPGHVAPVFAGDDLAFAVQVLNHSQQESAMIVVTHPSYPLVDGGARVEAVGAESGEVAHLAVPVQKRGRFELDSVLLGSSYPLGLLRAEIALPLHLSAIVYPRPYGNRPWPESVADYRTQDDGHLAGGDDFYGVRLYRPGESQRHIDWKAVARGRPLMAKEFAGSGTGRMWFQWEDVSNAGVEARVSQLTQWVVEADEARCRYGLRLPGLEIAPGTGPVHYHECLRALALVRRG